MNNGLLHNNYVRYFTLIIGYFVVSLYFSRIHYACLKPENNPKTYMIYFNIAYLNF